jgi:uncharacterized protein (DUF4415 family)
MTDIGRDSTSLSDIENPEWTAETFRQARPALDVISDVFGTAAVAAVRNRGGRPPKDTKKAVTTLRVDADVLERWQKTGRGWQTRVNALLREHAPAIDE